MIDIEKHMESFKESISKRIEKQEDNFKNLTDKVESFEETQKENEKRLSRLEHRKNTDENEDIELEQVRNLNFPLFFSFLNLQRF